MSSVTENTCVAIITAGSIVLSTAPFVDVGRADSLECESRDAG